MLEVRRATGEDAAICARIVEQLPHHFVESVPEKVIADLAQNMGWVALHSGEVSGFVIVQRRGERAAEILWMAVRPADRGRGVGTALLEHAIAELAGDGVAILEVKTLDRSAEYEPYEAARAFWESRGFIQIDMIDPLPGWPPENPAAIYAAALAPSR